MKTLFKVIILSLTLNSAYAATLEDVTVLELKQGKNDKFELKLHAENGPKDSYFLVDIIKSDKESFDKLALVLKKIKKKEAFKLSLEIPSFSMLPSGSFYRSDNVKFSGSAVGESLIP